MYNNLVHLYELNEVYKYVSKLMNQNLNVIEKFVNSKEDEEEDSEQDSKQINSLLPLYFKSCINCGNNT